MEFSSGPLLRVPTKVSNYVFSGAGGLAGAFTLDASTGFTIPDSEGLGTGYQLSSPLNQLTGSFGLFSFSGSDTLFVFTSTDDFTSSTWTLRAGGPFPLLRFFSNDVGGRKVTGLNMFIDYQGASVPPTLVPIIPGPLPTFNFNYSILYSDGTSDPGFMNTLQLVSIATVPEPSSLVLLAISLVGIWLVCPKMKAASPH